MDFLTLKYKATEETIKTYNELYTQNNESLQIAILSLKNIKKECEKRNIKLLVALLPIFYKLNDNYPFVKEHQFMKKIFEENKIDYIDFYDHFKGMNDYELWVHSKDKHPNSKSTSIIAKKMTEFLLANYIENK